jgi:mRNA interferase MazF
MGGYYVRGMAAVMDEIETELIQEKDFPRYGDIYEVSLDPVIGSETGKCRPALVVSNDINNEFSQTVTVLPITSQTAKKVYPFEVLIPSGVAGLIADSRVKSNQIRTVDKRRLISFKGSILSEYLLKVEKALKIHLKMKFLKQRSRPLLDRSVQDCLRMLARFCFLIREYLAGCFLPPAYQDQACYLIS